MEDRLERFTNAFNLCHAALGNGKTLNPLLYKIYYDSLSNFSIEEIETAFSKATMGLKWFPKPVELIEYITGTDKCNGDVQATNVLQAIKRIGAYESVNFNDTVTHAVINRVFSGWVKMCNELQEKDEKWFLKDFASYYKSFKSQGIEDHGNLTGLIASENSAKGIEYKEVKQIGQILKQIGEGNEKIFSNT